MAASRSYKYFCKRVVDVQGCINVLIFFSNNRSDYRTIDWVTKRQKEQA